MIKEKDVEGGTGRWKRSRKAGEGGVEGGGRDGGGAEKVGEGEEMEKDEEVEGENEMMA